MQAANKAQFRVSTTVSLVFAMAKDVYQEGLSQRYYENIDHAQNAALIEPSINAFQDACPITTLLFQNRKRHIRHLFSHYSQQFPSFQVCILAGELDPFTLHLLEHYHQQITRVFEVDREYMALKRDMYERILDDTLKVALIALDATDTHPLFKELRAVGYDPEHPTVFLLDGFIAYISREKLYGMLEGLQSSAKNHVVLLDYGLPFEDIPQADRAGVRNVIQHLEQKAQRPF